jgi:hypothetical protein
MPTPEETRPNEEEVLDASIEEDKQATTDLRYQISSYGADYPVDGLVKRLISEDIELPKFQREFVWPLPQASKFIESLLLGLPVPSIFLSKVTGSQKLLVIDGQQRLKSLRYFYEGIFRGKEFSLQGVNKDFEGATYKTLNADDRRRLDDAILHAIIIRQEDPKDDDSSIFLVFERLNTTSTPLSEQEIRACVYHGPFNQYLQNVNNNAAWRSIYGELNPRQKDKELLLRFFALFFDLGDYQRPMKLFLTNFMRKNRNFEIYSEETLNNAFIPTITLANQALGRGAFRPERALNASVTDAILVATAKRLATGAIVNHAEYKKVVTDVVATPGFAELYKLGTTDKERVTQRIDLVLTALAGVH